MLIAHFCFTLDPSRGGVPSGVVTTSKYLTKHGINNQIISFGNTRAQIKRISTIEAELNSIGAKLKYTTGKFSNDYGIGSIKGLRTLLANLERPDLIVLHQIYTFSTLIGYIFAKRSGIPFAIMPHGSLTKYHESDHRMRKLLAKWFGISKILREADAIIVTCNSERTDLDPPLLPKAHIIPYGAIIRRLSKDMTKIRYVSDQAPHIVFSGRFDKKKNLSLVIQAMPLLLEKYPDLVLDVAGSGSVDEENTIHKLVESLCLSGRIKFHGWMENSEMLEILSGARLLVLPSENENFGIVVAEALSTGLPCVVSEFVGTSDIILKHQAGEVISQLNAISVANAILKVLQGDTTLYRKAAFEAAELSLDWSRIAQQWRELVGSLA